MNSDDKSVGPKQLTQEQIDKTMEGIKQAMAQPMPNTDILDLTKEMRVEGESFSGVQNNTEQKITNAPSSNDTQQINNIKIKKSDFQHPHGTVDKTYNSVKQLLDVVEITKSSNHKSDCSKTLEEFIAKLLEPHLKKWLDDNLPAVVEKVVQKEIKELIKNQK